MTSVMIVRDDYGVPHISAEHEEGGFFGVGYAQAEDQLERFLRHVLHLRSETASVFGERWAELDLATLRWRHLDESRAGFERLPEQLRRNYEAFVAGVQRYMDDHPDEVPSWAPPLEPAIPVAIARAGIWWYAIADAITTLLRCGLPLDPAVFARTPTAASNGWVVMPSRTDGLLMVLSDPHADLGGFFEPFEFSIDAGRIRSTGMTPVGGALPIWGHTRHLAWALTTGGPVTSDLYAVECDPDDPRRFRYDGEWREMSVRAAEVRVKDSEPVRREFDYTDHNGVASPVVARVDNVAYVVSTPYMHCHELWDEQLYNWHLAQDIQAFRDAMRTNGQWAQNVLAGDVHGNAYYVRAGRTPIRPAGVDVTKPIPGNSSQTAWLGIHDLDDLVQVMNPACGYVQNCNVSPDTSAPEPSLLPDGYASYIYNDTPGRTTTRGERAIELFGSASGASVDDGLAWTLDEQWIRTENWQRALHASVQPDDHSPELRDFVGSILSFDGCATPESVAALRYYHWRIALPRLDTVTPEQVRDVWEAVEAGAELTPEHRWLLALAVRDAYRTMMQTYGSTSVAYGEVFRVGRGGHSFPGRAGFFMTRAPVGDEDPARLLLAPLRLMEYGEPDDDGKRCGWWGPRNLSFVAFKIGEGPVTSYACLGWGQSPKADSPHHADQAKLFSEHRLRSTYWGPGELAEHTVSTVTIEI
jgi:acyl-homoserine lactone acylase PvdQ